MCEGQDRNQYYIDTLKQLEAWAPAGCMVVSAENVASKELTRVKLPQKRITELMFLALALR